MISFFIPNSCKSIFFVFNQDTKKNPYCDKYFFNTVLLQLQAKTNYISQPNSQIHHPLFVRVFLLPNPGTSRKPMEMDRAEVIFVQTSKKLKM